MSIEDVNSFDECRVADGTGQVCWHRAAEQKNFQSKEGRHKRAAFA